MAIGNPYTEVSIVDYNVNPPTDDGAQTANNTAEWAKHKTKLADPVKTLAETTQTNITTALDKRIGNNVIDKTGSYTVALADRGKMVRVTSATASTITLPAVIDAKVGFEIVVKNKGAGLVTVDGNASETVDSALTIGLSSGATIILICDGTNWESINRATDASTGDMKPTFKSSADAGWVLLDDGTIGSASSGASNRANADTEGLFTLLWDNVIDTWAPVSTGRGASAAADFAADKTITLPLALGRALGAAGAGASLTTRVLGENLGAETHQLTESEMPSHTHGVEISNASGISRADGGGALLGTFPSASTGGDAAHNNMQPTLFVNWMIKL